jgi:hypothetical protein
VVGACWALHFEDRQVLWMYKGFVEQYSTPTVDPSGGKLTATAQQGKRVMSQLGKAVKDMEPSSTCQKETKSRKHNNRIKKPISPMENL